jgi:hypothetical protein
MLDDISIYHIKKCPKNFLGLSYYDVYMGEDKIFSNMEQVMATTVCASLNNAYRLGVLKGWSNV